MTTTRRTTRSNQKITQPHFSSQAIGKRKPRINPNNACQLKQRNKYEIYYKNEKGHTLPGLYHDNRMKSEFTRPVIHRLPRYRVSEHQRPLCHRVRIGCGLFLASTLRTSARRLDNMDTQFATSRCEPKLQFSRTLFVLSDTVAPSKRKSDSRSFKLFADCT